MTSVRQVMAMVVLTAGAGSVAAALSILWIRVAPASPEDPSVVGAAAEEIPVPPGVTVHPDILSVSDAVEGPGGRWFILDGRSSRWHSIGPEGEREVSAGRAGEGPGELMNPVGLALMGDTVVVGNRTAGTVERYLVDGKPLDRWDMGIPGCAAGVLRQLAVAEGMLHLLRECLDPGSGGSTMQVHRRLEGGGLEVVASIPWTDLSGARAIRLGRAILAGGGDLLLFGDATGDCLLVLLPRDRSSEQVCHPSPPRIPLSGDERRRAEEVRTRLAGRGLTLEVPEFAPPFDAVFPGRGADVVFRSMQQNGRRSLDRLEGGSLGGLPPDGLWTPWTFVGATSILTAGETMEGTWLLVTAGG